MIVFRYVSSSFLRALTAALVGMSSIYLIIDFADRAKQYTGPGIFKALVVLYTCKLALIVYQLAPAALGLAGAIAMSSLRKTNEVTALQALGRGPGTFLWPLGLCAALFALTLTLAEDRVVAPATEKAEAITFGVFHSGWGDWSRYHLEKKWYRGQNNRIYYLGHFEGAGFRDVTIYDLTPDFRLNRRVDADQIEPLPDGRWRFLNATTRTFDPLKPMFEVHEAEHFEQLPEDVQLFRVKTGQPSQQRRWDLPSQIKVRKRLGLPYREWEISYFERLAYQLAGIPAAILGAVLALRPRRKGHLTAALGEGFGITIFLWTLTVFSRTLSMAGHLPPFLGGFLPTMLVTAVTIAAARWAR